MRKSRSRGNVEGNFTRASALGEILMRPGESEIVWEIFVQCAKILSLRTAVLSSPKKQCHDPPLFGKILGCQREGKRKKSRSKAAGKQARRSAAALQRRTSSPRARKGSDDRDTKTLPNIPFHTGKGWKPGGSMERHCKVHFTLQVQVKFEPESSDPIGASTENSPTSFT
jgi:hypothetical protein